MIEIYIFVSIYIPRIGGSEGRRVSEVDDKDGYPPPEFYADECRAACHVAQVKGEFVSFPSHKWVYLRHVGCLHGPLEKS